MLLYSLLRNRRGISLALALVGLWAGLIQHAAAQKAAPPGNSLRIAGIRFDPKTAIVDVDLVNHARSGVTAYGMSVITMFSDGTSRAQHLTNDISQSLILRKVFPEKSGFKFDKDLESLRPGEHTHFKITLDRSESAIRSIKAVLTAAMFADGTSKGNKRETTRIHSSWSQELQETRHWLPEFVGLRSAKDLHADALKLSAKLARAETDHQSEPDIKSMIRQTMKMQVEQMSGGRVSESDRKQIVMPKVLEITQARATLLSHQLEMARKGGGR